MKYFEADNMGSVIKSWCNNPEEEAIKQAQNIARLPFIFRCVCLMPDAHTGFGVPIGGVFACENVVIPNAVGVDIGCGMAAVRTNLKEISPERLKEIMTLIRKKIPLGFEHHSKAQDDPLNPKIYPTFNITKEDYNKGTLISTLYPICSQEQNSALKQLGTLGGGNHFIEIQKGSDSYIWFMIHSGSRNLGFTVAKHYNNLAKELNKKWFSSVNEKSDLAFLPVNSDEGQAYIREMNFCLQFAQANRDLMVARIKEAFNEVPCLLCNAQGGKKGQKCPECNGTGLFCRLDEEVKFEKTINIHHNYARLENHFGKNVWVHRKGATSARKNEVGIIPGSQGTASYIVNGKGNPESFMSCSHGAGRKMSRTKAQENLNLEEEKGKLDQLGIIHSIRTKKDLDEAAGAYKDISTVMEEQKDLVDILVELKPLAVIKG